jgi:DNA-binding response OmpR family regulator
MNKNIAIVDDEADIVELVSFHLKKNNYNIFPYYNANTFLDSLKKTVNLDLIILDLMLPDMDGFDICKILRSQKEFKKVPIIMLTAKNDEIDKVIGLEVGADDYVTKPFSPRELIARVKALLRRSDFKEKENDNDKENDKILNIDNIIFIDTQKYEVYDNESNKINLTNTEFKILKTLLEKRGWVFSRDQLLNKIWGEEKYVIDRTIDVHIKNLREKLHEAGKLIKNVRGVGYKLENKK